MGQLCCHGFFIFFIFATIKLGSGADNTTAGCFQQEKQALLRFKQSLKPDPSNRLASWTGDNCCQWLGVGCDNATGHVTRLDLRTDSSGLVQQLEANELNTSMAELTHLSYMDLSGNYFSNSPVPEYIGSMTRLRYLNLSSGSFSGTVPTGIQNLSNLRVLDLSDMELVFDKKVLFFMITSLIELRLSRCDLSNSHFDRNLDLNSTFSRIEKLDLSWNSFEGEFPPFLKNLTSLKVLDLSYNKINSSIPVMNNVVKLNLAGNRIPLIKDVWNLCRMKWMDLSFNYIEGALIGPPESGPRCTHFGFETLVLNDNKFSGEIPTTLERLTELKELNIGWNQLTGKIPKTLTNLTSLTELDLSGNQLTGSIPTTLGKLVMLRKLDLSENFLNGTVPFSIGKLSDLKMLYLNFNILSSIPFSLGNLSKLEFLDLSSNLLNGSLPQSFGQLSNLQFLDLSNNSLNGIITEAHFENTSMLKHLAMTSNNMLNFKISRDWVPPFQISHVFLGFCKIESEFPHWIRTQKNLVILILSNTFIFGSLPDWFSKLPIIPILDLSHNLLTGPLTNLPANHTVNVRNFPFIERFKDYAMVSTLLLLKNNLFNGSIPDSLCNVTDLVILDLSRNMLSGNLPNCFENLPKLNVMILSSNQLSGVIPASLGRIGSSLQWLHLNNNTFHGELPANLANFSGLNVLDLGENRFSGNIPKWVAGKMKSLVVLRLHNNNFSGDIPAEFCESSELQIMDFGDNNLTGTIPGCFQKLHGMTGGDSNLYFSGGFEQSVIQVMRGVSLEYTTIMRYVVNMDLSNNHLVGEIPANLTVLSGLIGLNLSHNQLTGRIPGKIGDMSSLMSLDLSVNNLSGTIPQSLSELTFLSHLNLSKNELSGRIPRGNQLQTLIDPSVYGGNVGLCGTPLMEKCNSDEGLENGRNNEEEDDEDDDIEKIGIYLAATGGFVTGFLGILGVLVFKKRWRVVLFNFVEVYIAKKMGI